MTSDSIRSLLAYALPAIEREFKLAEESENQQMDMAEAIAATRKAMGLRKQSRRWQPREIDRVRLMMERGEPHYVITAELGRGAGSITNMVRKIRRGQA